MLRTHAHAPCIICRQKHDTSRLDQLRKIKRACHGLERTPVNDHHIKFNFGTHKRCSYGISCEELHVRRNEESRLEQQLHSDLIAIALSDNNKKYNEILHLLRGHFPAVYHQMEQLRAKKGKES